MNGISPIGADTFSVASLWQRFRYYSNLSAAQAAGTNPARTETPVEPVERVKALPSDVPVRMPVSVPEFRLPEVSELNNAAEQLARMRIQYPEEQQADVTRVFS